MKPGDKFTCPACGNAAFAKLEKILDGWNVKGEHLVCSFCGAPLTGTEAFCPECGSPRGGIVCPTCHTLNDFAFCKQCGTALTDEARQLQAEMEQRADYQELLRLAREYEELQMQLPA